MKKLLSTRSLWILAIGLSSWAYIHLALQKPDEAATPLSSKSQPAMEDEAEATEEKATFHLPDLSLLRKAIDLAGKLAGFNSPE